MPMSVFLGNFRACARLWRIQQRGDSRYGNREWRHYTSAASQGVLMLHIWCEVTGGGKVEDWASPSPSPAPTRYHYENFIAHLCVFCFVAK